MSTVEPAVLILNSHLALAQTAELEGAEVHVPEAVIDLLQAHVFADADRGDVDPPAVPPNATVGAERNGLRSDRDTRAVATGRASVAARTCSRLPASPGRAPRAAAPD